MSAAAGSAAGSRERWLTRWGLVLALAGNAVGLGNFLRFPRQAALNGGGAFLIPYFVCLIAIGIPLLFVECAIGRYGGRHGRGHTPGMFDLLWRHPAAKYVGVLGLFIPFSVATYYVYVESWCLAYAFFSLTGRFGELGSVAEMGQFLAGYQGLERNDHFDGLGAAYAFFALTFALNVWVLLGGVARGIERLALRAMPLLFLLGIVLTVRVLTLDPPPGGAPDQNVLSGLGFVWNPDFSALADARIWLAAAGQVFFTLSVGWGIIQAYASYMGPDDDVVLTGLSTASLNEFAEVILGGSIALTASVVFFGVAGATRIAEQGSFDLGFQAMPLVLQQLPAGGLFGALWFLLLFCAGITSSVALLQPLVALLQEGFGLPRRRAVGVAAAALLAASQPVILLLGRGWMDQLDFWAGELALLVFGLLEVVIFVWVFGRERAWSELTRGARLRLPGATRALLAWGMPLGLAVILGAWCWQNLGDALSLEAHAPQDRSAVLAARLFLVGELAAFGALVWAAFAWGRLRGPRP